MPTNWVPIPGQAEGREADGQHPGDGGGPFNSIFIACADRVGTERGQPFSGQSLIVGHTGWPVAGPASRDAEEILIAESISARPGVNAIGTPSTRCCVIAATTSMTRCSAPVRSAAGTDPQSFSHPIRHLTPKEYDP